MLYPTKVDDFPMQVLATATAITREISYPQPHPGGWFSFFRPLPVGRMIVIACYWAVIAYMLTYRAIINDAYYWERIGFRGGWISVTQVPLVYLLASKSSILGFIVGTSHERLNWLHRWLSRTLLITVTVHGSFFMAEWVRAEFVTLELELMPMVKYGLGAWGILVWTFITSLSPMRRLAYEFFVLQHIVTSAVFLWVLYVHVPSYAQYNIWFAIGALMLDRAVRTVLLLFRNVRIRRAKSCGTTRRIGHQVELQASCSEIVVITIKDVHLSWKAGQHMYLWLPRLGPLESHPFTIASPYKKAAECHCNEIQFVVRVQSGFSKRIHKCVMKTQERGNSLTGFIAGPYGTPPSWEAYESLILISASTGASFTMPILESILASKTTICTQRIHFLLVVRKRSHIEFYAQRLNAALSHAESRGIELRVEIAITSDASSFVESEASEKTIDDEKSPQPEDVVEKPKGTEAMESREGKMETMVHVDSLSASSFTSSRRTAPVVSKCCCDNGEGASVVESSRQIIYSYQRPDVAAFIRQPVEVTGGETSVAVCGGKSLVATVRNSVATLSDERAVHKGTGAQGIHLHVEEYCF
jgi:NAD(P)H-flavin reductase